MSKTFEILDLYNYILKGKERLYFIRVIANYCLKEPMIENPQKHPPVAGLEKTLSLPLGGMFAVALGLIADLTDYDELKSGQRREAVYYGIYGIVRKTGWAACSLIMVGIFSLFGFTLENPGYIELSVFDVSGAAVKNLADGYFEAGHFTIDWDGTTGHALPVSSGLYYYRMKTTDGVLLKRMLYLK